MIGLKADNSLLGTLSQRKPHQKQTKITKEYLKNGWYCTPHLLLFDPFSNDSECDHYIPNFLQLNKTKKYEILAIGINIDNPDYNTTNTTISIAVQNFIFATKRFSEISP